jgi:hypothetical protein
MARGTQLIQLVTQLRVETGRSDSVALGVDELPALKHLLKRTQENLYDRHPEGWAHLRTVFDRIPLLAGDRYYDFPDTLNFDRIEDVAVWDSSTPLSITRGIGFEEYAVYDSESDVRAEPACRWDIRWTGSEEQIEIWPVPSTNNQELQFIGTRKLRDLIENDDVCDLDDQLIVLFAAAELLVKSDKDLAARKLTLAEQRYALLTRNAAKHGQRYIMGSGPDNPSRRDRVSVRVSRG